MGGMSFTENDRNFRSNNGKSFPIDRSYDRRSIVGAIAEALRNEFGEAPSAVKRLARLTTSNERTVRNWLDANNGPNGESLIKLMQHSDAVFEVVLQLASRPMSGVGPRLTRLRESLAAAVTSIDAMSEQSGLNSGQAT
jgi:hypothetical protein